LFVTIRRFVIASAGVTAAREGVAARAAKDAAAIAWMLKRMLTAGLKLR